MQTAAHSYTRPNEHRDVFGQRHGQPMDHSYRASSWSVGEPVPDPMDVPVKDSAPAGTCWLQSGLCDRPTTDPLPVLSNAREAVGGTIVLYQIRIVLSMPAGGS
jgi:hypothetical protein